MDDQDWLARQFEANRNHLRAVAYRMLGSPSEADDAVQEAWLRLSRSDVAEVENLGGWLTTVVARVALDALRSRKSRREESLGAHRPDSVADETGGADPEREVLLADSIGPALLAILETLTPSERLAYVLHDLFAVPFEEIAPIVDRTPVAARQLASRARRRVQGSTPSADAQTDLRRRREVVDAFLLASRSGDFAALLAVLDPDAVLRADAGAVQAARAAPNAPQIEAEMRGGARIAETFVGRARGAKPALVDGLPGAVWAPDGHVRSVFVFAVERGRIAGIEIVTDPNALSQMAFEF
ncbi:MAG TPA: sigma-70 family RNA polymerase sigma factor [Luteimonas sp.]|nr:sigma-70 family RNA polymerase sigma factor [Luteimonas sp.]